MPELSHINRRCQGEAPFASVMESSPAPAKNTPTIIDQFTDSPDNSHAGKENRKRELEKAGIAQKAAALWSEFGIRVETEKLPDNWPDMVAEPMPVRDLAIKLEILRQTLEFYPPGFFTNHSITTIYILSRVQIPSEHSDRTYNGLAMGTRLIFAGDSGTVHHEIFHCLDYSDGPLLDDVPYAIKVYGMEYDLAFLPSVNESPAPGYVSSHAQLMAAKYKNFTEDQAEVAKALLIQQIPRKQGDTLSPELVRKIEDIKQFYFVKSNGLMDDEFWRDLTNGVSINQLYWREKQFRLTTSAGQSSPDPEQARLIEEQKQERQAFAAYESKDNVQATRLYEILLRRHPTHVGYHQILAELHERLQDYPKSLWHHEQALLNGSRDQKNIQSLKRLLPTVLALKPWWQKLLQKITNTDPQEEKISYYQKLLARLPKHPLLLQALAREYALAEHWDDALALYHTQIEAQAHGPDYSFIWRELDFLQDVEKRIPCTVLNKEVHYIVNRSAQAIPDRTFFGIVDALVALGYVTETKNLLQKVVANHPQDINLKKRLESFP